MILVWSWSNTTIIDKIGKFFFFLCFIPFLISRSHHANSSRNYFNNLYIEQISRIIIPNPNTAYYHQPWNDVIQKIKPIFPTTHTHQLLIFANHKSTAQYHNRKRAQTLRWTKSWRRANKKVAVDKQLTKKLVKKTTKVFKAFVGLSLDDLKQRQTDDFKRAQQQAAERAKKSGDKKEVKKSEVVAKSSIPKHVASRINKAQARK